MSLQIDDLDVRYGVVRAVRGVSFTARPGEVTALIGANGAGKTSILRTVAGLIRPAGGRVRLDGTDITAIRPDRLAARGVALVPEGRQLFDDLTVAENLRMGLYGTGSRGADAATRTAEAVEVFPALGDIMERRAGLLSGGQQQMVAIARALVRRPRLLLLDEPSLGLAPRLVTEILTTVRRLADGGVTVLLAEQNAVGALRVSHQGVVVQTGRIVAAAGAADLLADEEISRHYLGAFTEPDPEDGSPAVPEVRLPESIRRTSLLPG